MIRAAAILLLVAACEPGEHPVTAAQRPRPPFDGCLRKPAALPPIATVAQVRSRHDRLDRLYDDCAVRALRNAQAFRFYIRR